LNNIVFTNDGSQTIYNKYFNEHYHSTKGAFSESLYVFIENGFNFVKKNEINIFEVGFGTGLNAILTLIEAEKTHTKVNYFTIEKFPITKEIVEKIDFSTFVGIENQTIFEKIHKTEWNMDIKITNNFSLHKINEDIVNFKPFFNIDLTYFDCFSFDTQPELWTTEIFEKIFSLTTKNGILVTYAAKGIIKENLRKTGFQVKRLKGALGKHHMLKATKV
jgi:tRNA U34 5-methylaminomethyl-2-thiouridine-forming methyltransferase MnmC